MTALRISRIVEKTKVEGPGLRYAIWVQGCPIRCEGCFNPHTWEMDGGKIREIDEIVSDIQIVRNASPELEGVTFLGASRLARRMSLACWPGRSRR